MAYAVKLLKIKQTTGIHEYVYTCIHKYVYTIINIQTREIHESYLYQHLYITLLNSIHVLEYVRRSEKEGREFSIIVLLKD